MDAYTAVQEKNHMFWYSNNTVFVNDAYVYGLHTRYYKPDGSLCHPNDGGIGYKPAVQAEFVLTRTPFTKEQVGQMEILHTWERMPYQYNVSQQANPSLFPSSDKTLLCIGMTAPDSTDHLYSYNPINGTLKSFETWTDLYKL